VGIILWEIIGGIGGSNLFVPHTSSGSSTMSLIYYQLVVQ
jgi:hypothetical protein